ncbi:MAG: efflux RND transporter permease subunit, partial [Pseudomonadota bacterium]
LLAATAIAREQFDQTPGLIDIEDNRPLPGIDWQIDVDVEKAGRYGADVATVGGMVQLVTRGILLDTMRVDSSDEEIDIRVRFPAEDRVLATLDTLKVRTNEGLIPLSNFISRQPVAQLAEINRINQTRFFDVKAGIQAEGWLLLSATAAEAKEGEESPKKTGLALVTEFTEDQSAEGITPDLVYRPEQGALAAFLTRLFGGEAPKSEYILLGGIVYDDNGTPTYVEGTALQAEVQARLDGANAAGETIATETVNENERIAFLTEWLENATPLPAGVDWEWTGDAEDQAESAAFLQVGFSAALGLMFIILLAQFNSVYNAVLVLLAVVLSTTGVLIGMLVMDQPFSIIMTGTGIVALAGIVVNNNIVLIDTYQEYSRYMPRIEAIIRTAEARIRPVLLTTITTMAGLAPMMFGLSLDFFAGGYSVDSPTALWWKQLATAVVFGLGIATVLTLVFTPSMLALRVWFWVLLSNALNWLSARTRGSRSRTARDWALARATRKIKAQDFVWDVENDVSAPAPERRGLRAAE